MADAKDIWVIQSPKAMAKGEAHAYTFDFTDVGDGTAPSSVNWMKAYDYAGTDQTATVLGGATSLVGYFVTGMMFTPGSATSPVGNWRLVMSVQISGNTVYSAMDVAVFDPVPAQGTITTGSYGAVAQVAALVPKHANRAGTFDDTTRPSGTYLATLIDQVSALLNSILAENGFSIPVTDTSVKPMLDLFVNQEVAAIVEGINGSGRYGATTGERKGGTKGRFEIMLDSVKAFVAGNKIGMERLGADRSYSTASSIIFRSSDEQGDDVDPLFQRKMFGEVSRDWGE